MSPPVMITFFVNVIYISFPSELFCGLVIFSFDAERQQTDASVFWEQEGICERRCRRKCIGKYLHTRPVFFQHYLLAREMNH